MAEEEDKKKSPEAGKKGEGDKKEGAAENSGKPMLMGMIGAIVVLQVIVAFVVITVTKPKPAKPTADTEQIAEKGHGAKAEEHGAEAPGGHGAAPADKGESSGGGHGGGSTVGMHVTEKPCDVVINIAGTDNKSYLKVAVAFAFHTSDKKFGHDLAKVYFPIFKHYMIEILSPMTLEELSQSEAKEKFRKELLRKVQEVVPKEGASMEDVFIIDYLIQ